MPVPAGHELVVTTDLVAEGVHFFAEARPELIGRYAAASSLSDLAAMGAMPLGFVVAYGLPRGRGRSGEVAAEAWLEAVAEGLAEVLDANTCPLLGGDTKEARARIIVGTALGAIPKGQAVTRGGALPGDLLVLTGPVGGPAAALARLEEGLIDERAAAEQVLDVTPRVAAGRLLRELDAHALTDLSDGLARAAVLIGAESALGLTLEAERVPLHPDAAAVASKDWASRPEGRRLVLGVGGEYELLAAVDPHGADAAVTGLRALGLEAQVVGRCGRGSGAVLETPQGLVPLGGLGWTHFG